jgi:hypothetical protein
MLMAALGRHQVVRPHSGRFISSFLPTWHRNDRRAPEPTIPGPSDTKAAFRLDVTLELRTIPDSEIDLHLRVRLRLLPGCRAVWVEMH